MLLTCFFVFFLLEELPAGFPRTWVAGVTGTIAESGVAGRAAGAPVGDEDGIDEDGIVTLSPINFSAESLTVLTALLPLWSFPNTAS